MTRWSSSTGRLQGGVLVLAFVFVSACGIARGAQQPPPSFADLVKKVSPGVVNIIANKLIKAPEPDQMPFGSDDPYREFFERFFGTPMPNDYHLGALGSGFVIDAAGLILTNNHVVEDSADLKVRLANDREYQASIVGRDPKTDTALIRIEAEDPLTPLPLGDSEVLEVGDWVVAIGNPFGLGNTVTSGIVSAKYRRIGIGDYDNFIQTDAAINPGNSGGPLLNTRGEVVGINSIIFSESAGSVGIGFAIPINMVKALLPQLRQGKVRRPFLGVMIQNVTPALEERLQLGTDSGALVSDVIAGSPADKAGVQRGDVIVSFDGKPVVNSHDLPLIVGATPVDHKVDLEVLRRGRRTPLTVMTREMVEENGVAEGAQAVEITPGVGLTLQALTPELAAEYALPRNQGLLVVLVDPEGAAAGAGLQPGDIIVEVEQEPVDNVEDFRSSLRRHADQHTLLLLVDRDGNTIFVTIPLALPPS
jgi:serine protease Do